MKRILVVMAIAATIPFASEGETMDAAVKSLVAELSAAWSSSNTGTYIKPTVSTLRFLDAAGGADGLGAAIRSAVESYLARSTTFVLVDRDNLEASLREIELSLSGIAEGTRLGLGGILDVDCLLAGEVAGEGNSYRISLRLVDVETSRVLFAGTREVDKGEADRRAAEYRAGVFRYGFGIEMGACMLQLFGNEMSAAEGQSIGEPIGSILFLYRPFPWLVAGAGVEGTIVPMRLTRRGDGRVETLTIPYSDVVNMDKARPGNPWPAEGSLTYRKERAYYAFGLLGGFVYAPVPEFNVTAGTGFQFAMHRMSQEFRGVPHPDAPASEGVTADFRVEAIITESLDLEPFLKLQWFFSPRLSLNAVYQYRMQLRPLSSSDAKAFYAYSFGTRQISGVGKFYELWNLDPSVDPYGNRHHFDLTGHRVTFSLGMYF